MQITDQRRNMNMMKVTIKWNQPIGDFKAIEKRETFNAISYYKPEGTSLIYFKLDRFNTKVVGESEIVSIEEV